jgi:uncharacterized protein
MQLREVAGFGDKTFEQAAGFLRIKDGDNPLDRTAVHPESYPIVERMASSLGVSVNDLIENPGSVNSLDFKLFENELGKFTVGDIREELLKPGRDPRDQFVVPKYRDDVKEIADLKDGMELEGTVTNVTNFGAFVDLGVHQDGLVHISELSHKYIQDARHAVKVGDVVKVKVIGVDPLMKRISLSIKAVQPKPKRRPRARKKPAAAAQPAAQSATAAASAPEPKLELPKPLPPPPRLPTPLSSPMRAAKAPQVRPPQPKKLPQIQTPKPLTETTVPPTAALSLEEKIRLLQEKFGRTR